MRFEMQILRFYLGRQRLWDIQVYWQCWDTSHKLFSLSVDLVYSVKLFTIEYYPCVYTFFINANIAYLLSYWLIAKLIFHLTFKYWTDNITVYFRDLLSRKMCRLFIYFVHISIVKNGSIVYLKGPCSDFFMCWFLLNIEAHHLNSLIPNFKVI